MNSKKNAEFLKRIQRYNSFQVHDEFRLSVCDVCMNIALSSAVEDESSDKTYVIYHCDRCNVERHLDCGMTIGKDGISLCNECLEADDGDESYEYEGDEGEEEDEDEDEGEDEEEDENDEYEEEEENDEDEYEKIFTEEDEDS